MNKQFVPYELALKLKELGFNEECFGYSYRDTPDPKSRLNVYIAKTPVTNSSLKEDKGVSLPLWQQAFDWFREKYELNTVIYQVRLEDNSIMWDWDIVDNNSEEEIFEEHLRKTYKEARQACLEKLIELCQE